MPKHAVAKKSRFWTPLVWLGLYCLNLGLILLLQALFIHTLPRPLTTEALAKLSYFNGCEVLDVTGEGAAGNTGSGRSSGPCFLLYRTAAGQAQVVQIEQNPYLPRFRIVEDSVQTVPSGSGTSTVSIRDFFGANEILIEDQCRFAGISGSGFYWQHQTAKGVLLFLALLLLLVESALTDLWRRLRKKLRRASEM